ncbi:MAG: sporulation protein YunB [Defluviitaleaceae bacterium]|nr:sporulation protein YunB [Defluviitaleaceae bacterium]
MTVLFVSLVDRRLMPAVIHIEEYRINARMNQAINTALAELAESSGGGRLVSEDFYVAERAPDGRITSLAANVILINEISAGLSHSLLKSLSKPVTERVSVPIGTLLGLEWLANIGPTYSIRVMPVGAANVEYNTSFTSAGINQINFQVWLTVKATMQIVNPLQSREIDVERSIPLVNTVFAGEIPEVYLWPMGR